MKQIVKYRLIEGTIPDFISDGGYFYNNNLLVGVTVDGASLPEDVSIFNNKQELIDYVSTFYIENDVVPNVNIPTQTVQEAVDLIWEKL